MAHGNWSDLMALVLFAIGIISIFWPHMLSQSLIPGIQGFLDAKTVWTQELVLSAKVAGLTQIIIAGMLSVVRWNDVNGKLPGILFLVFGGVITYWTYGYDNQRIVYRPNYVLAVLCAITFLHLIRRPCDCEKCLNKAKTTKPKANTKKAA